MLRMFLLNHIIGNLFDEVIVFCLLFNSFVIFNIVSSSVSFNVILTYSLDKRLFASIILFFVEISFWRVNISESWIISAACNVDILEFIDDIELSCDVSLFNNVFKLPTEID